MQLAKPIVVDIMKRLNPSFVLDLGCGSCRLSKRLLKKGASVVGVDKNVLMKSCDNFKFIHRDVLDFCFEDEYDLIIASAVLHYLEKEDACLLIEKMKKNTVAGGFHFLICMSNEEFGSEEYFYPNGDELGKLYSDWEIINNMSCFSKEHGEPLHRHKMIVFFARKV